MQCIQCNKDFESSRITARYCSSVCRVKASRVSVTKPLSVTEKEEVSVTDELSVTDNRVSVTLTTEGTGTVTMGPSIHPDRDNIWSRHYDTSEDGFRRRNKNWLDASGFKGTPAQQEAARQINRAQIMVDNIRINREHVATAISEAARRMKQEAVMEAIRKIEG